MWLNLSNRLNAAKPQESKMPVRFSEAIVLKHLNVICLDTKVKGDIA
jgi:hypothetical protein